MSKDERGAQQRIMTVERAVDVLVLFTQVDQRDLGVTEVANALGLSKAVVHRVLTTLLAKGLVEIDETTHRYRLGHVALSLGVAFLDRLDLREVVLPQLRRLSEQSNETATMSLRYGWERMYVEQITPNREVKMTVVLGRAFPLHAGSSSKAFLAFLPAEEQERYLEQRKLDRLTEQTITDAKRLRKELALIREQGFAISFGERQDGAGSIAAPVLDHRRYPAAAISLCGPIERFRGEVDQFGELLLDATSQISRQLGYRAS